MENNKLTKCCICGCMFYGFGNNPDGAACKNEKGEIVLMDFDENDRCCDDCDSLYVIPGRMYRLAKRRENEKR